MFWTWTVWVGWVMVATAICHLIPPFNSCSVNLAHVIVTHGPLLYAYGETRSFFCMPFCKSEYKTIVFLVRWTRESNLFCHANICPIREVKVCLAGMKALHNSYRIVQPHGKNVCGKKIMSVENGRIVWVHMALVLASEVSGCPFTTDKSWKQFPPSRNTGLKILTQSKCGRK